MTDDPKAEAKRERPKTFGWEVGPVDVSERGDSGERAATGREAMTPDGAATCHRRTFFKWDQKSRYDLKKEQEQENAAACKAVCQVVDARDKRICRACGKRSNLDGVGLLDRGHRHHIVYRSAGGTDESSNLVTLCARDHNEEHMHRLEIRGNADEKLEFWRRSEDGWYLDRRELAPHVLERD